MLLERIDAVIFDKDGTLIDFAASWDRAVGQALRDSTPDDRAFSHACEALGYDERRATVLPGSVLIAEPWDIVRDAASGIVDVERFGSTLARLGIEDVSAMAGLVTVLDALAERSISLAVATNDYSDLATEQLQRLGVADRFGAILGVDSVARPKPAPDMVLAAADALAVLPQRCLMVGDSAHDLAAGRLAGASTVLIGDADCAPETPGARISGLIELLS